MTVALCFVIFVLVVALVATNLGWIHFFRTHLIDERSERWQLQERIREPEAEHVPISELIKEDENKPEPSDPIFTDQDKPVDEFDVVGKINPDLPLREDDDDKSEPDGFPFSIVRKQ